MSPTDRSRPPGTGRPPDPDDPPNAEELRAAEALRRALEHGPEANEEARALRELAQAVRAVASPASLSSDRQQQLLDRALGVAASTKPQGVVATRPRKAKIPYLALGGAAGALAMAAAVAMVIRGAAPEAAITSQTSGQRTVLALALSRSTAELFPEGIPRSGRTSDRVDRIAYARAQDFRRNQFARWGTP